MERYSFDQNIKRLIESGDYIEGKKEGQWFEENKKVVILIINEMEYGRIL